MRFVFGKKSMQSSENNWTANDLKFFQVDMLVYDNRKDVFMVYNQQRCSCFRYESYNFHHFPSILKIRRHFQLHLPIPLYNFLFTFIITQVKSSKISLEVFDNPRDSMEQNSIFAVTSYCFSWKIKVGLTHLLNIVIFMSSSCRKNGPTDSGFTTRLSTKTTRPPIYQRKSQNFSSVI